MNRHLLLEEVQQVRHYLDGRNLVIDSGRGGWFKLYTVLLGAANILALRELDFRKIHPVRRLTSNKELGALLARVGSLRTHVSLRKAAESGSAALQRLGFSKQRDVLIATDLSGYANPNTGGKVGGLAHKKSHAVELDSANLRRGGQWPTEAVCHEWAHKWLFNAPSHVKKYVEWWYSSNVVKNKEITGPAKVSKVHQRTALAKAYGAFSLRWQQTRGFTPEGFLAIRRRFKDILTSPAGSSSNQMLLEIVLRSKFTAIGKMKKAIKRLKPDGEWYRLRKGDLVQVVWSKPGTCLIAAAIDSAAFKRAGVGYLEVAIEDAADVLELNRKRTEAANQQHRKVAIDAPKLDIPLLLRIAHRSPAQEFAAGGYTLSEAIQAVAVRLVRILGQEGYVYSGWLDLLSADSWSAIENGIAAAASKDGEHMDVEGTVTDLFLKHGNWEPNRGKNAATALQGPDLATVRKRAFHKGVTPSEYAAGSFHELWAETVAYAATKKKASKQIRQFLKNVVSGNTAIGERLCTAESGVKFVDKRSWHPRAAPGVPGGRAMPPKLSVPAAADYAMNFMRSGRAGEPPKRSDRRAFAAWLERAVNATLKSLQLKDPKIRKELVGKLVLFFKLSPEDAPSSMKVDARRFDYESKEEPGMTILTEYRYHSVTKSDITRALTNHGMKERGARNLMRRLGPSGVRKYLSANLGGKSPRIQRQWRMVCNLCREHEAQQAPQVPAQSLGRELESTTEASPPERVSALLSLPAEELHERLRHAQVRGLSDA